MGAAVILGCDASPIFRLCEHVFDLVALFVQSFGAGPWCGPVGSGWNAGFNLADFVVIGLWPLNNRC